MTDHFSTAQRLGFVLLVAAIATVGLAAIGGAQTADYSTNDSVTLTNDTEPITVSVDWNESATTTDSATVTFENETAANNTGDVTADLQSETLDGTNMTMTTVYPVGTYTADLNQSEAGTVSVNSSAFDSNGTVDLATQTTGNVTAGDAIVSVDFTTDTLLSDSIAADPGNTTESEYNQTDNRLEIENEYRVTVTGNASVIDSASIDASGLLGGVFTAGGGLESGGALVGLVVIGMAVIGAALYTMRD